MHLREVPCLFVPGLECLLVHPVAEIGGKVYEFFAVLDTVVRILLGDSMWKGCKEYVGFFLNLVGGEKFSVAFFTKLPPEILVDVENVLSLEAYGAYKNLFHLGMP